MSATLNSNPSSVFANLAAASANTSHGPEVKTFVKRLSRGVAKARSVVTDVNINGAIEATAMLATLGFASVFMLAVFGVPMGLN